MKCGEWSCPSCGRGFPFNIEDEQIDFRVLSVYNSAGKIEFGGAVTDYEGNTKKPNISKFIVCDIVWCNLFVIVFCRQRICGNWYDIGNNGVIFSPYVFALLYCTKA